MLTKMQSAFYIMSLEHDLNILAPLIYNRACIVSVCPTLIHKLVNDWNRDSINHGMISSVDPVLPLGQMSFECRILFVFVKDAI